MNLLLTNDLLFSCSNILIIIMLQKRKGQKDVFICTKYFCRWTIALTLRCYTQIFININYYYIIFKKSTKAQNWMMNEYLTFYRKTSLVIVMFFLECGTETPSGMNFGILAFAEH